MKINKDELIKILNDRIKSLPNSRISLGGYHSGQKDAYENIIETLKGLEVVE
jgi:hypothetical protein